MLVPIPGDYALVYSAKDRLRVLMIVKVTPKRLHYRTSDVGYIRSVPREHLIAVFNSRRDADEALLSARKVTSQFRDQTQRNEVEFAQALARYKAEAERIDAAQVKHLKDHFR